jgi:RNA polymerase sigma-70 factor (ECF subfamily)
MNTTTSDAQDQADMMRLASGNDAALSTLMTRHGERLFHYLIRLLQNETEAADLAQETFVRVYLNRFKFQTGKKFSTWLYTIATNLARDRIRWQSRHRQVSLDSSSTEESGLVHTLPSNELNPLDRLESEERVESVRLAIAGLSEDLRTPFILAEYEGQSHAEIAAVLDCSAKAVEMRIYRARQQLRTALNSLLQPEKKG